MDQKIKVFRVFIASPNDLADERRDLREVVDAINRIYSQETDWRIELLGWEDTLPGAGRPQDLINVDLDKADLFIGCLWRRWGTPSGGGGRTGFEEEFERALKRRTTSGLPEMWLFFKHVDEAERNDPGEQLKKVLAFREREEKAKRLLFQHFSDVADWHRRLEPLLHRHLLRVFSEATSQKESQTRSPRQTTAPSQTAVIIAGSPKKSSAVASIASILTQAGNDLQSHTLLEFRQSKNFGPAECARLLVFAASLYAEKLEPVQFGSHEANSILFYRAQLDLTEQERLFLIKAVLLDLTLTKPGWFWLGQWRRRLSAWLPLVIKHDRDDLMRAKAIALAENISFSLRKESELGDDLIHVALNDDSSRVRVAALQYLAIHGRNSDLAILRPALKDSNPRVRSAADRASRTIRIRSFPDKEFRRILSEGDSLNDDLIAVLGQHVSHLTSGALLEALEHQNPELRMLAADELRTRRALSVPVALQLSADEARAIKARGILSLIDHRSAPTPAEIRSELADPLFPIVTGEKSVDLDQVIAHRFSICPENELWVYVEQFDENSHLALRELGRRFSSSSRQQIRDSLVDDFKARAAAAKKARETQGPPGSTYFPLFGDPVEDKRKLLRATALEVLANDADPADRPLFQRYLSSEVSAIDQTIACLRGLAAIGNRQDREAISPIASTGSPFIRAAAARTYLTLSETLTAGVADLLQHASETIMWVIVALALQKRDKNVWKALKPLLNDDSEEIRRLVCFYAAASLKSKQLLAVMEDYLQLPTYYYNVIVLLDRALYAPIPIRKFLAEEEVAHFDKLRLQSTRSWPGLDLRSSAR